MWVPPEDKDPVLLHAPTGKSIAVFGAINLRSRQLVTMYASPFNAESFAVFLRQVARYRDRRRRNLLILDNASYHRQPTLPATLALDPLPPYSPDLNPIERVWKLLRRLRIHNVYFETLEHLTQEVTAQLVEWSRPNHILRRLCCIT